MSKYFGSLSDNVQLVATAIVCVIVIALYGKYRCANPQFHDPLLKKLGVADLDGWSLSHFFFFMLIGYLFPDCIVLAMVLGTAWEAFEYIVGEYRPKFIEGMGHCVTTDPVVPECWWYGKVSDLVMNLSGFLIGMSARTLLNKASTSDKNK